MRNVSEERRRVEVAQCLGLRVRDEVERVGDGARIRKPVVAAFARAAPARARAPPVASV